ncbi:hypothetical protein pb186bvf_009873 [Paramecium bursaria]
MAPFIEQQLDYNNCPAILFLRKYQQQYQSSNLLDFYNNELDLFLLLEDQSALYIIRGEYINELGSIEEKWFTDKIDVFIENIQIIIQFSDMGNKYISLIKSFA